MNKIEYLKRVDELNFSKDDYVIISGGNLLIHGLRSTTEDIDLAINDKLFLELNSKGLLTPSNKMPNLYNYEDDVELKLANYPKEDIEFYEGYPTLKLLKELEWKINNKRDKDKKDIENIKRYLKIK